jgi:hypothetical protein
MVRANAEHDRRAGLYQVLPTRRRRSRRWFDFLVLCACGNGLAVAVLTWIEASRPTLLIAASGMLFYTVALGWVMFVQHDDY